MAGAEIEGDYGTLVIDSVVDGVISYTYTLNDNIDHSDGDPDSDSFGVQVVDSDGNDTDDISDTLEIAIVNDAPIAEDDTDSITEDDTSTDGNVILGTGTTTTALHGGGTVSVRAHRPAVLAIRGM